MTAGEVWFPQSYVWLIKFQKQRKEKWFGIKSLSANTKEKVTKKSHTDTHSYTWRNKNESTYSQSQVTMQSNNERWLRFSVSLTSKYDYWLPAATGQKKWSRRRKHWIHAKFILWDKKLLRKKEDQKLKLGRLRSHYCGAIKP